MVGSQAIDRVNLSQLPSPLFSLSLWRERVFLFVAFSFFFSPRKQSFVFFLNISYKQKGCVVGSEMLMDFLAFVIGGFLTDRMSSLFFLFTDIIDLTSLV